MTYVYCLVASPRRPSLKGVPAGLHGMKRPRLLDLSRGQHLVVADAPLPQYGEDAINTNLSNIDWVSRAAVAHEAVVEFFIDARGVLPMKLFTIFANDERALAYMRGEQSRIDAILKRVANHQEWGVRVVLDRKAGRQSPAFARSELRRGKPVANREVGKSYLAQKKAQRDLAAELARNARETVADLYDRFAKTAALARRRSASEMPADGGPLLLDAAFLVPSKRGASFQKLAAREAKALARSGYHVTLTGPWPAYSFIQD